MREGLKKVGAPEDLIQIISEPDVETSKLLMQKVDIVVATGGGAMVKAAYSSGTPAYGVGPGNAVQIIAEDADVKDAVNKVILSKTFDNATSCSSENRLLYMNRFMIMLSMLLGRRCLYMFRRRKRKLRNWMWVLNKKGNGLNPKIIAQMQALLLRTQA